uniref:Uncharacterized protein n=1 Tax=Parascaris equorum TaxID=6256 RepID=A0A914RKX2_PAREQ
MSGAINLKKVDEKSTFKRTKVIPKRRVWNISSFMLSLHRSVHRALPTENKICLIEVRYDLFGVVDG